MKLAFICDAQFDILTPILKTLPDAEGAVCFLATELARLGHNITIFSRSTNNVTVFDVRCRKINFEGSEFQCDPAFLESDYDAMILVNNNPELIEQIKSKLTKMTRVYLWTEFDHQHSVNKGLNDSAIVQTIDGIICVSDWQRSMFIRFFNIPRDKIAVRYYAISPYFEDLFYDGKEFTLNKSKDPVFAYLGNPLTGLNILIDSFHDVTLNYPTASLTLFDNPNYNIDKQKLADLLQSANQVKGFKHIGVLSNVGLANQLRPCSIFAYPNTAEITSSVTIMNAMAAGLYVVTSNLGAIPEYCTEHGKCVTDKNLTSDSLDSFIGQVLAICQSQTNSPSTFFDYCFKQSIKLNKSHTWRMRAREWVKLLIAV